MKKNHRRVVAVVASLFITLAGGSVHAQAVPVLTSVSIVDPTIGTLTPGSISVGAPIALTAAPLDESGAPFAGAVLSWVSSDETVASIDANGTVTGLAAGSTVLTVTATDGTISVRGTLRLTTYVLPPFPASTTTIAITPLNSDIAVGGDVPFTATVSVNNPGQSPILLPMATVEWSSGDTNIGTIDSTTGLFTARAPGTVVITATSGVTSATATATVFSPSGQRTLTGVALHDPTSGSATVHTLTAGTDALFTAHAVDQFGVVFPGAALSWSSSNPSVATVSPDGLVTAVYPGTFVLTASASDGSITVETAVSLAVVAPPVSDTVVAAITFAQTSMDLVVNQGLGVTAQAFDRWGTPIQMFPSTPQPLVFTWTTSSSTIATVVPYPNDTARAFIKAVGQGTATITVSSGSASATIVVTAIPESSKLASLKLSPAAASIEVGATQQFVVTAFDQYGAIINPLPLVSVMNSNGSVALLDSAYLATGLMPGQTLLTAYGGGGITASVALLVTPVPGTFGITSSAGAHGTVIPSGYRSVTPGSSQSYVITPDAGYRISDVLVDGTSVGTTTSYSFVSVSAGHTIRAVFAPVPIATFTVTSSAGPGGVVSPVGAAVVTLGASQTYTMTPNNGFQIADVLVDGVSVGAVSTYVFANVSAPHTISVSFVQTPVVLASLVAGWNLIGWTNIPTTAEAFGSANIGVDLVSKWDALTQSWVSHIIHFPLNNFTITAGDGIFTHKK